MKFSTILFGATSIFAHSASAKNSIHPVPNSEQSIRALDDDHPTGFTYVGKGRCVELRETNDGTVSYNYPGVWEWFIRGADSKCFDWCLTNPQDLLVGVEIYKSWLYMHCYCAYSGWPKDKSITDYNLDDYSPSADRLFTGFGGGEIEMRSAGYEDADIAVCYKNNDYYSTCQRIVDNISERSLKADRNPDVHGIINGKEVSYGRYPYLVFVASKGSCTGSLVAYDVVLTAAHCVSTSASPGYVRINGHNRLNWEGEGIPIAKTIKHPNSDVALLVLERPTTENVHLVNLNSDNSYPGLDLTATAMGWGKKETGWSSNVAMEVDLSLISNADCAKCWDPFRSIGNDVLCTFEPGHSTCTGDSGGPLIIAGVNSNQDVQIGISTFALKEVCVSKDFPNGYARVSHHFNWIKTNVCESSSAETTFQCDEQVNCSDPPITETQCNANPQCFWRPFMQQCAVRRSKASKNAKAGRL